MEKKLIAFFRFCERLSSPPPICLRQIEPLIGVFLSPTERLHLKLILEKGVRPLFAFFAKPLDVKLFSSLINQHSVVATFEDHAIAGGFGSAIIEMVQAEGISLQCPINTFGVKDAYVPHATQEEQQKLNGYDSDSISQFFAKLFRLPFFRAGLKPAPTKKGSDPFFRQTV